MWPTQLSLTKEHASKVETKNKKKKNCHIQKWEIKSSFNLDKTYDQSPKIEYVTKLQDWTYEHTPKINIWQDSITLEICKGLKHKSKEQTIIKDWSPIINGGKKNAMNMTKTNQ